jgi:hypothetical protein
MIRRIWSCVAAILACSMAANAQPTSDCPAPKALVAAVETVTGRFTAAAPPDDTNALAAALARPFEECQNTVSNKPVCRYALTTRVKEIYAAWKKVQPATLRPQVMKKTTDLDNAKKS